MWFKNAVIYQLNETIKADPEMISSELEKKVFQPCAKMLPMSMGWVSPTGVEDDALVFALNGFMLCCLKIEEKILPATVLREHVNEKISQLEEKEDRKVYRKERENMKEEAFHTLLPQAFTKSHKIYGYFDTKNELLIIDAASEKKSDVFTTYMRKTLGSLQISPPEMTSPEELMSVWLQEQQAPVGFDFGEAVVLQSEEKAIVRCQNQDLFMDSIQSLLTVRYQVMQLAFQWDEKVSFVLTAEGFIKRIRFMDMIIEQSNDIYTETSEERFAADFSIMTETLQVFIDAIMKVLSAPIKSKKKSVETA